MSAGGGGDEGGAGALCRACLAPGGARGAGGRLLAHPARDLFMFCTGIQIGMYDNLPKSLCDICYNLVVKFYKFKQLCLQSDDTLQKWLQENGNIATFGVKVKPESDSTEEALEPLGYEDTLELNERLKTELEESKELIKLDSIGHSYDELHFGEGDLYAVTREGVGIIIKKRKIKKKLKRLKINIKSNHKSKLLSHEHACDECHRRFAVPERLKAHKLKHHGDELPLNCDACNKIFKSWDSLKRHNLSQHAPVDFESLKCQTCGKIFKTIHTLKRHKEIHEDRKPSMCHICGRGFKSDVTLRGHLETHTENRERIHGCGQCDKKFYTVSLLSTHVSRRHSGRRYICQVCSYPFVDKYSLSKHLLKHDGIKPYECDICNKGYSTHSFLIEHKRMHTGEKPFICDFCTKRFVSKKRLIDHRRTHTGERPYKCSKCEQAFIQRGTLKRHMKIHDKFSVVPKKMMTD